MLPLGHTGPPQYWIFTSAQGKNILFLWNLNAREGTPSSDETGILRNHYSSPHLPGVMQQ